MFDNLEIAGARLGGFLMFEPDEPYRSLVQGMRVQSLKIFGDMIF